MSPLLRCSLAGLLFPLAVASAQNVGPFPDPIAPAQFAFRLVPFATLPNSFGNTGARVNLVTTDPAGRLFANDQRGPLYHISDDGTVSVYLDLRDPPYNTFHSLLMENEAGFMGFAFHPDFHTIGAEGYGRLYTIFSTTNTSVRTPDFGASFSTDHHVILLEWKTDNPAAVPFEPAVQDQPAVPGAPFRELMRLNQPFGNHNSGIIAFNRYLPPGDPARNWLWIAMGDAGGAGDPLNVAQNPSNPYGAILRIDPIPDNTADRYDLVLDNVLASDGDPNTLAEIYAYGLRNPQWFGWDASTDALYAADIGQSLIEEINVIVNGGHYGWDLREGDLDFQVLPGETTTDLSLIGPAAAYDHFGDVDGSVARTGGRAITCGEVLRGTGIHALDGLLFAADFPTGNLLALNVDTEVFSGGNTELRALPLVDEMGEPMTFLDDVRDQVNARGLNDGLSRVDVRFGVFTPGEVYVSSKRDGVIRRLVLVPEMELTQHAEQITIDYVGRLQWRASLDTGEWTDVEPQPLSPWTFTPTDEQAFYRAESN
ncbi:MAG: PQQ-dependent sugar dehydrogenase [Opitutales bacterium]